jgi:DNA-binding NtrC family response regulator
VTRKVLLVDDSEIVIESVKRWLEREDYEVIVTHTCAEAKLAAKEDQVSGQAIDVELTDGHSETVHVLPMHSLT